VKQWFICVVIAFAFVAGACQDDGGNPNDPSQVNIEFSASDLVVGTGAQAANGNSVSVHYELWLYNNGGPESKGTRVQGSRDPGSSGPFTFTLGLRQTIPGFEQGVLGMRVGGRRRIYVPSQLGYGAQGAPQGGIPPNAALVFEVELLSVN
jgi:FKBP-type peptidyl-prolyl cis-trans isomerase FkpA